MPIQPLMFPDGSDGKAFACIVGDVSSIPGSGRSPGEGNGTPLQYSYLEKPMDRGAWQATVRGVTKGYTHEWFHFHFSAVKHVFWFMQFYIIDFNFLKLTWSSVSSFPLDYSGKEELVFIISSSDSKMWLLLCAIPICWVHSAPYHGRKDLKNVPPFPVLASPL